VSYILPSDYAIVFELVAIETLMDVVQAKQVQCRTNTITSQVAVCACFCRQINEALEAKSAEHKSHGPALDLDSESARCCLLLAVMDAFFCLVRLLMGCI
jgi:hypothetical protein